MSSDEFVEHGPKKMTVIEADSVEVHVGRLEITVDENGRATVKLDGHKVEKLTGLILVGGVDDVWKWRAELESIIDPRLQNNTKETT